MRPPVREILKHKSIDPRIAMRPPVREILTSQDYRWNRLILAEGVRRYAPTIDEF